MSIIPIIGAGVKGGSISKDGVEDLMGAIVSIPMTTILASCSIYEGLVNFKNKIKNRVQLNKNKIEFKDIAEEWRKLSEGKVGTLEKHTEGNSTVIVIHTENGPMIRSTTMGNVVKSADGETMFSGKKVSYTGIQEVENNGKKQRIMYNNFGIAQSDLLVDNNRDEIIIYNTDGSQFSENGEKVDCFGTDRIYEGQPAPMGEFYQTCRDLKEWFQNMEKSMDTSDFNM